MNRSIRSMLGPALLGLALIGALFLWMMLKDTPIRHIPQESLGTSRNEADGIWRGASIVASSISASRRAASAVAAK